MDRRSEIYALWNIQESLLQQYRAMAIGLLGLISAGILVLIAFLLDVGNARDYCKDDHLVGLVLMLVYLTLLLLGSYGSYAFRVICQHRAKLVTFFQNLLIADESGALDRYVEQFKLPANIPYMHIFRRAAADDPRMITALPIELVMDFDIEGFIGAIMMKNQASAAPRHRHYRARRFLSQYIFRVFDVFFSLCALIFFITAIKYLEKWTC